MLRDLADELELGLELLESSASLPKLPMNFFGCRLHAQMGSQLKRRSPPPPKLLESSQPKQASSQQPTCCLSSAYPLLSSLIVVPPRQYLPAAVNIEVGRRQYRQREAKMKSNRKKKSRGAPSASDNSGSTELSWADLPGEKLAVDLAHQAVNKPAGRKRARKSDDGIDEFDTQLWKSEHYDGEDETINERQVDQDLFDPNPEHKSNKFDPGNTVDGAHDAGMFYR